MHWMILGAGAIGCLWAAHLQQAGQAVSLILRNPQRLAEFQALGGVRLVQDGTEMFCPLQGELASGHRPIEYLLVCTKAYDSEAALASVLHRLTPDSRMLILQNGMGTQQQLIAMAGTARVLLGSTTEGAYLRAPFEVVHAGRGETAIGTLDTATTPQAQGAGLQLDARFGLQLRPDPDILATLWRKLAINCAINPLTALYGCRNGELAEQPRYTEALSALCQEFEQVANALGIRLFEGPLREHALDVARKTGDNYSSMLQDIRRQRPTEIDQITGFLCLEAARLGVDVPNHRDLLQKIHQLQDAAISRPPPD